VRTVGGMNQLTRDAESVTGAPHTAFEHMCDSQSMRDSANILLLATEGERGRARDHFEPGNVRQEIDDLLSQPV
jgi:hypothetical protein